MFDVIMRAIYLCVSTGVLGFVTPWAMHRDSHLNCPRAPRHRLRLPMAQQRGMDPILAIMK